MGENEGIVERLRRFASGLAGAGLGSPGPLMNEAADEIERLRAEVEMLQAGMVTAVRIGGSPSSPPWQPIETAPKDGQAFLITTAGPQVDICFWDGESFRDYFHKQKIAQEWPYMVAWMPLPEPADVMAFEPTPRT